MQGVSYDAYKTGHWFTRETADAECKKRGHDRLASALTDAEWQSLVKVGKAKSPGIPRGRFRGTVKSIIRAGAARVSLPK